MLEDTLEIEEDEELEEEAGAEVDKVLFELTDGKLGLIGPVGTGLPVSLTWECPHWLKLTSHFQTIESTAEDEETERNMEQYRQQLDGLLST